MLELGSGCRDSVRVRVRVPLLLHLHEEVMPLCRADGLVLGGSLDSRTSPIEALERDGRRWRWWRSRCGWKWRWRWGWRREWMIEGVDMLD